MANKSTRAVRRRIEFDDEMWHALRLLSADSGKPLQGLADEAFRDLLVKHHRPANLREALRRSARMQPANDAKPARAVRRLTT